MRADKMASGIDRMLLRLRLTQKLRDSLVQANAIEMPAQNRLREILAVLLAISTLTITSVFFVTRLLD